MPNSKLTQREQNFQKHLKTIKEENLDKLKMMLEQERVTYKSFQDMHQFNDERQTPSTVVRWSESKEYFVPLDRQGLPKKKSTEINKEGYQGKQLIHYAAGSTLEIFNLVLDSGIISEKYSDINAQVRINGVNMLPIHFAILANKEDIVLRCIEAGTNLVEYGGYESLLLFAENNNANQALIGLIDNYRIQNFTTPVKQFIEGKALPESPLRKSLRLTQKRVSALTGEENSNESRVLRSLPESFINRINELQCDSSNGINSSTGITDDESIPAEVHSESRAIRKRSRSEHIYDDRANSRAVSCESVTSWVDEVTRSRIRGDGATKSRAISCESVVDEVTLSRIRCDGQTKSRAISCESISR